MALQELVNNKLRSSLSLFGIAIGIFCIVSVLALINSLESKIKADLKSFGTNTIYIDKWDYGGDGNGQAYPWWRFIKRPEPKYEEMNFIKLKSQLAKNICYFASANSPIIYKNNQLNGASIYCATSDLNKIQTINVEFGRYFNDNDFDKGTSVAVIGYEHAQQLFGKAEKALNQFININGKTAYVIGIIKKQGKALIPGFDFDNASLLNYKYFASIYTLKYSNPTIMVQGKDGVNSKALQDELRGVMRQIHKLSPKTEDDFSVNDINQFTDEVTKVFAGVNQGGWFIAGLSLLVGGFGVANIMFVTVRERTSQIGLKKALGAKRSTILIEFLLESAFLCSIGGALGLFLVWLISLGLTSVLPFPLIISGNILFIAVIICISIGLLAGIIPASIAAKLDPVVAIRSK